MLLFLGDIPYCGLSKKNSVVGQRTVIEVGHKVEHSEYFNKTIPMYFSVETSCF